MLSLHIQRCLSLSHPVVLGLHRQEKSLHQCRCLWYVESPPLNRQEMSRLWGNIFTQLRVTHSSFMSPHWAHNEDWPPPPPPPLHPLNPLNLPRLSVFMAKLGLFHEIWSSLSVFSSITNQHCVPHRVRDEVGRQDEGSLPLQTKTDGLGANAKPLTGNTRKTGSGDGHRDKKRSCCLSLGAFCNPLPPRATFTSAKDQRNSKIKEKRKNRKN